MVVQTIFVVLVGAGVLFVAYVAGWIYLQLRIPKLSIPQSATEQQRLAKIDWWLRNLHELHKFNGGVLIARDDAALLMSTYGFTDHTAESELTVTTPFRLASISKQFTAAAILVLVEQGRIVLDDPIVKYLHDFPWPDVTIRYLLNQTSGIPDIYMSLAEEHRAEVGEILCIADVVTLLRDYPPEVALPGSRYEYSNTNYVLLAAIIERVSQLSLETFMRKSLFEPLGMTGSRVWNRLSSDLFPDRAADFDQIGEHRTEVAPTWIDGITRQLEKAIAPLFFDVERIETASR